MKVIAVIKGVVPQHQQRTFEEGFRQIKDKYIPDGLIKAKLLHDEDNPTQYQVESTWEDRDSFEKFREQTNPLPAVALFKQAGSQAEITVFDVTEELTPTLT
jgi:heme-degrading monooxygenase HmoA